MSDDYESRVRDVLEQLDSLERLVGMEFEDPGGFRNRVTRIAPPSENEVQPIQQIEYTDGVSDYSLIPTEFFAQIRSGRFRVVDSDVLPTPNPPSGPTNEDTLADVEVGDIIEQQEDEGAGDRYEVQQTFSSEIGPEDKIVSLDVEPVDEEAENRFPRGFGGLNLRTAPLFEIVTKE